MGSGFVAVGETSDENNFGAILVTRVDTEGNKVWSQKIGTQLSAAHTIVESGSNVIVGGGLYSTSTGKMQATLMALDSATGSTVWSRSLDHSGHGAIRGVILDAGSLVTTVYVGNNEGGFLFIADGDNARAMAWKFDLSGNLLTSTPLGVDGMQQGAKIRADPVNGGYAIAGSVWMDDQQGIVVKLNSDLSVAWSQDYGLNTGADQIFDLVVDSDGNYLLGGHTTAGTTNWDYLAIKVDGATKQQLWRKTFGQPRGFDPGISTTRCGECRWIPRATTSCWEDPETSIPTVQNLEAGPATSGSPTSWWSARTGTSSTRASTT